MEPIETLTLLQIRIVHEIYVALERLGADLQTLAAVGSWGDTLPELDVLSLLEERNKLYSNHESEA